VTVLSDSQIIDGLISGQVVCRPLRPENIRGSSIDLTLGEWFWRCDARPEGIFNPCDEAEVERYFAGPFQAKPYASVYRKIAPSYSPNVSGPQWPHPDEIKLGEKITGSEIPFKGIPRDWPVIVLRPGERILAHSHEFVGIRAPGTSMLKARSGTGRIGVKVCDDAGWGDPDYIGRWTWEVRNDNAEAIILPVGDRYAQLVLFQTGPVRRGYVAGGGSYQGSVDVDRLVAEWKPEMMLPQWWRSQRLEPLSLDGDLYEDAIELLALERDEEEYTRSAREHAKAMAHLQGLKDRGEL
jgi:deoxycytidine triphosphate deaminase